MLRAATRRRRAARQQVPTAWGSSPHRSVRFSPGGTVRVLVDVDTDQLGEFRERPTGRAQEPPSLNNQFGHEQWHCPARPARHSDPIIEGAEAKATQRLLNDAKDDEAEGHDLSLIHI